MSIKNNISKYTESIPDKKFNEFEHTIPPVPLDQKSQNSTIPIASTEPLKYQVTYEMPLSDSLNVKLVPKHLIFSYKQISEEIYFLQEFLFLFIGAIISVLIDFLINLFSNKYFDTILFIILFLLFIFSFLIFIYLKKFKFNIKNDYWKKIEKSNYEKK